MNKLERAAERARVRAVKAHENLGMARLALREAGACTHASAIDQTEETDNGYGHWYTRPYKWCPLCLCRSTYGGPWVRA